MTIVVDASIAGAWLLPDEADLLADEVRHRYLDGVIHVPPHWRVETLNILLKAERRGRIDGEDVDIAIGILSDVLVEVDTADTGRSTIALARRHGLTSYDAAYLELATRLGLPLATLDRKLQTAAEAEVLPQP